MTLPKKFVDAVQRGLGTVPDKELPASTPHRVNSFQELPASTPHRVNSFQEFPREEIVGEDLEDEGPDSPIMVSRSMLPVQQVRAPPSQIEMCKFTPTYRSCSPIDAESARLFFDPKETLQCCSWLCERMPCIHSIIAYNVAIIMKTDWKPPGEIPKFALQVLVSNEGISRVDFVQSAAQQIDPPLFFSIESLGLADFQWTNEKKIPVSIKFSETITALQSIFSCLHKNNTKKDCGDIFWRPSELISGLAALAGHLASDYFTHIAMSEESKATYAKRNEETSKPSNYVGSQQTSVPVNVKEHIATLKSRVAIIESGNSLSCQQPIHQDKSWSTRMRYGAAAVAGLGGLGLAAETARRLAKSPSNSPSKSSKGQR